MSDTFPPGYLPGSSHPFFKGDSHQFTLFEWVNGRGSLADHDRILFPVRTKVSMREIIEPDPVAKMPQIRTMRRVWMAGPAPWTGRPFVYIWPVGVDDLGRTITGEVYRQPLFEVSEIIVSESGLL